MLIVLIIASVIALCAGYCVSVVLDTLQNYKIASNRAWSNVVGLLRERYEVASALIKLAGNIKAADDYIREISTLRVSINTTSSFTERNELENTLQRTSDKLIKLLEGASEFKEFEKLTLLNDHINSLNTDIKLHARKYIAQIINYNSVVNQSPTSFVALSSGHKALSLFSTTDIMID